MPFTSPTPAPALVEGGFDPTNGAQDPKFDVMAPSAAARGVVVVSLLAMTRQAASAAESATFCRSRRARYVIAPSIASAANAMKPKKSNSATSTAAWPDSDWIVD